MKRTAARIPSASIILFIGLLSYGCEEQLPITTFPENLPRMHGMSLTSFAMDGFRQGIQRNVFVGMKTEIANDWVALCVFEYQRSIHDTLIGPNETGINPIDGSPWSQTSNEEDIAAAVLEAHTRGIKVMLKPHVDCYSNEFRGGIRPDEQGKWFTSYSAMIRRYAMLASQHHVEMLCIGTELVVATTLPYADRWRELIDSVRIVFSGELIYASNWNGAPAFGIDRPEYEHIGFWNKLDYVGVDAYYPITLLPDDPLPSYSLAQRRISAYASVLAAFSSQIGKRIVITETGVQSVRGALAAPWDYLPGRAAGAIPDESAQELYYRVVIDRIGKQHWCAGIFWWNWETLPTPYGATDYTPRGKPAAVTLREWYGSST